MKFGCKTRQSEKNWLTFLMSLSDGCDFLMDQENVTLITICKPVVSISFQWLRPLVLVIKKKATWLHYNEGTWNSYRKVKPASRQHHRRTKNFQKVDLPRLFALRRFQSVQSPL